MPGDYNKEGDVAEAEAAAELTRLGYTVSRPVSGSAPYDLIAEKNGTIHTIQVKSSDTISDGKCQFFLRGERGSYGERVDIFILYSSPADLLFAIPRENAPETAITIDTASETSPYADCSVSVEETFA